MKKILLLSDTHGYLDDRILDYVSKADEVWHAGDIGTIEVSDAIQKIKPLRAVHGNIDGQLLRSEFPLNLLFEVEEVKVFMTHIGGYPGRYEARIKNILETENPHLYICGHSHILKVMPDRNFGIIHMNPGAAGIYGHHTVRTMIRFELNKGKVEKPEVIEFKKRT